MTDIVVQQHLPLACRNGIAMFMANIDIKDADGVVHTVVERTVYIAEKNYYRQKSGGGDNS